MYEALLEFPEGWGGVRKNPFCAGGGMDIFWNYTFNTFSKCFPGAGYMKVGGGLVSKGTLLSVLRV